MDTRLLAAALRIRVGEVRAVNQDADQDAEQDEAALRDAATLLRVLANVVDGKPLARAFGPPGDWGYETEIGRALAAPQRAYCLDDADLSHL